MKHLFDSLKINILSSIKMIHFMEFHQMFIYFLQDEIYKICWTLTEFVN
jgi:hypothetical protein